MYYQTRKQVGEQLAVELQTYRGQHNAVVALSDGSVLVAQPIAKDLDAILTMLLLEPVKLPGESDALLSIREDGNYTFDDMWSMGQLEEFEMEYRTFIEQAKQQGYSELRHALGVNCLASSKLLHDKNIILVSDGLRNGSSLEAAVDFLKPMPLLKIVAVTPFASADALDKMRLLTDEVHCLGTVDGTFDTDHYYEDNTIPPHADLVKAIEQALPASATN